MEKLNELNTECKLLILVIVAGLLIGLFVLLHYFPKKCQTSIISVVSGDKQVEVKHERSCYCVFEGTFWSIHNNSILSKEVSV